MAESRTFLKTAPAPARRPSARSRLLRARARRNRGGTSGHGWPRVACRGFSGSRSSWISAVRRDRLPGSIWPWARPFCCIERVVYHLPREPPAPLARGPRSLAATEPRNLPISHLFCDTSPKNSALSLTGCNLLESRGPAGQTFLPALGRCFLPGHVVRFGG